jgi:hypothetical protein
MRHPFLVLPLLAALPACATVGGYFDHEEHPISSAEPENAVLYLDLAEQELEAGHTWRALERLIAVREFQNLPPEVRLRSEDLIDRGAERMLAEVEERPDNLELLEELWELDLSPRMRAKAGIRYAERLLEEGSRVSAYKQVREVEGELPSHGERARAGRVLFTAGMSMIEDPGRYYLILRYSSRGSAALEYLVLTYPLDPACPQAYGALASYYEEENELELAIERHEDLLNYHIRSPEAVAGEAAIPRLRLDRLERPDHDRSEIVRALSETQAWLARHKGAALEPEVQATELRCFRMLADSDLVLARYYQRTGTAFGWRTHAERALSYAQKAGDAGRAEEAGALLADLPPAAREGALGPPSAPAEAAGPDEASEPAEAVQDGAR